MPLCQQLLIPAIEAIVDSEMSKLTIQTKLSMDDLLRIFDSVNSRVLEHLFRVDNMTKDKTVEKGGALNQSFDSFESEELPQRSYILAKLCEYFAKAMDEFSN